ncbi:MAG: acylphosphatase [Gammaproteobacteria bacterium]|nr:acylphosphatase [Gammaproteobacteria bacterium]MDH3429778.1 acylphosphatase [Gammaproteobacteria bacterium]MDH3434503.1 acylphosphatase [Gammaproteobacteria bacterium]
MADARRFTIRGRVQGVFFRDSTRRVADSHGITGHAINLANGDVEVFACGEPAALDKLATWLNDGPPMAQVTDVIQEEADWQSIDGFTTG